MTHYVRGGVGRKPALQGLQEGKTVRGGGAGAAAQATAGEPGLLPPSYPGLQDR